MKKLLTVLLAALMVFTLVGCSNKTEEVVDEPVDDTIKIAMVTDVGQLNDGGFNQYTFQGVVDYCEAKGVAYKYFQPANGADATDDDRIQAMHDAIELGAEVIFLPGYLQAAALEAVAKENPEIKFLWVDGWNMGLQNVTAICYKEEQSGFLAGYGVATDGYTSFGFTGGGAGTNAAVNRFAAGYVQGINAACAELGTTADVIVSFQYGAAFSPSTELQTQISGWLANGTQVVFSCGGSMLQSVKAAAAEYPDVKMVGVDNDQASESDQIITTATKNLTGSVVRTLTQWEEGKWDAELADVTLKLGAAENGVNLPTAEGSWRFAKFTQEQYNAMFKDIVDGKLVISDAVGADMSTADAWTELAAACPNVNLTVE